MCDGHCIEFFNKLECDLVVCGVIRICGVSDLVNTILTFCEFDVPGFEALVVFVCADEDDCVADFDLCNFLVCFGVGVVVVEVDAVAVFCAFNITDTNLAIPASVVADLEHVACIHCDGDFIDVCSCVVCLCHGEVCCCCCVVPVCLAHVACACADEVVGCFICNVCCAGELCKDVCVFVEFCIKIKCLSE